MLFNTRTYSVDRVSPDAVSYAGPANTLTVKDVIDLKRIMPKPDTKSGFLGVAKPLAKITKTVVINATTGQTADMIFNLSASIPVGTAGADVDATLADLAAWVNTTDSKALFKALDINA